MRTPRKGWEAQPLEDERMDVALAVLIVAAKLERQGRRTEAFLLKQELGLLLCHAAIYESEHPKVTRVALAATMKELLVAVGTAGVEPATPALSRRYSSTELRARKGKLGTGLGTGRRGRR